MRIMNLPVQRRRFYPENPRHSQFGLLRCARDGKGGGFLSAPLFGQGVEIFRQ